MPHAARKMRQLTVAGLLAHPCGCDCMTVIPTLPLNEKGSLHGPPAAPMTKDNKTASQPDELDAISSCPSCSFLLSFLPSSRTHKSRPAHKGCQVSAIRQSRDVCPIGVYCEENERERERERGVREGGRERGGRREGPGGAALSIRESFSLALSAVRPL